MKLKNMKGMLKVKHNENYICKQQIVFIEEMTAIFSGCKVFIINTATDNPVVLLNEKSIELNQKELVEHFQKINKNA